MSQRSERRFVSTISITVEYFRGFLRYHLETRGFLDRGTVENKNEQKTLHRTYWVQIMDTRNWVKTRAPCVCLTAPQTSGSDTCWHALIIRKDALQLTLNKVILLICYINSLPILLHSLSASWTYPSPSRTTIILWNGSVQRHLSPSSHQSHCMKHEYVRLGSKQKA